MTLQDSAGNDIAADLIVRNANIIDGTGNAGYRGDIAVSDDRISAVGDLSGVTAGTEIDAQGLALAPGFIDSHTHDDHAVLTDPDMVCKISQGVTTVVTGNCGISLAPLKISQRPPPPIDLITDNPADYFSSFSGYLDALDQAPPAVNVIAQVGHSTLRLGAMADLQRSADASEILAMRKSLDACMQAGAVGMSTGLYYPPAKAASSDEVIEIGKTLSAFGGVHTTHMRDEADGVLTSIRETVAIGKGLNVPVLISHHKCSGTANHGRSKETLALIDEARAEHALALDMYPYVASSTMLGAEKVANATRTLVTWSVTHPQYSGQDLNDVAADMKCSVEDAIEALLPAGAIYFMMDEDDVRRIMAYPHTMIGSDGLPGDAHPHPRLWGTFPRVLGHYARDEGLFPVETAVKKMTSMTATQFSLKDRGVIRVGAFADFVLFNTETVRDTATFETPATPAEGIEMVFVNGRAVWREGSCTGARPGRALRLQNGQVC